MNDELYIEVKERLVKTNHGMKLNIFLNDIDLGILSCLPGESKKVAKVRMIRKYIDKTPEKEEYLSLLRKYQYYLEIHKRKIPWIHK